jgi:hypothetical protein
MKSFLHQSALTANAVDISMIQTIIDKAEQSSIVED